MTEPNYTIDDVGKKRLTEFLSEQRQSCIHDWINSASDGYICMKCQAVLSNPIKEIMLPLTSDTDAMDLIREIKRRGEWEEFVVHAGALKANSIIKFTDFLLDTPRLIWLVSQWRKDQI